MSHPDRKPRRPDDRRRPTATVCLFAAIALAACGGGGDEPPQASAAVQGDAGGGGTPSPTGTPAGGVAAIASCGLPDFADDALRRINALRVAGAACGARGSFPPVPPIGWNGRLDAAAAGHSQDMASRDYVAHLSPEGLGPGDRIAAQGYDARAWAENIAAGYRDTPAVLAAWMGSDGHCANLMSAAVREIGLACVRAEGTRYTNYWTLKLGAAR